MLLPSAFRVEANEVAGGDEGGIKSECCCNFGSMMESTT